MRRQTRYLVGCGLAAAMAAALGGGMAAATRQASAGRPQGPPTAASVAGTSCEKLAAVTLPAVTIVSATPVPAGEFRPAGAAAPAGPRRAITTPAFCRVVAVATPTADSHINLEVWMPAASAWNGKLLAADNGGFSGAIGYGAMASALGRGYATVGTDTGHTGDQMEFGRGHPEKIVDWAYRSVHVMTDIAKRLIRDHFGRLPEYLVLPGMLDGRAGGALGSAAVSR